MGFGHPRSEVNPRVLGLHYVQIIGLIRVVPLTAVVYSFIPYTLKVFRVLSGIHSQAQPDVFLSGNTRVLTVPSLWNEYLQPYQRLLYYFGSDSEPLIDNAFYSLPHDCILLVSRVWVETN